MAKFLNRFITFVALGIALVIGATTIVTTVNKNPSQTATSSTEDTASAFSLEAEARKVIASLSETMEPNSAGGVPEVATGGPDVPDGYAPQPAPAVDGVAALEAKDIPALARAIGAELARQGFVSDELKRNPGIVAEALVLWGRQQQGDAPEIKPDDVDPALLVRTLDGAGGVYVGPADAAFTAVEFIDPNCPHCRHSIPAALAWIDQNPGVRILFRELPVIARQSPDAARVAIALGQQGLYRQWLEAIAGWTGGVVDGEEARKIARTLGADMTRLEAAAAHPDTQAAIAGNLDLGAALNIDGTPAWIVGSKLLIGSTSVAWLTDFAAQQGAPLPDGAGGPAE